MIFHKVSTSAHPDDPIARQPRFAEDKWQSPEQRQQAIYDAALCVLPEWQDYDNARAAERAEDAADPYLRVQAELSLEADDDVDEIMEWVDE